MSEYLLVNDVHLSDRAPSSCTDTYNDDLFDLLRQVARLAVYRQASAIILAGDVFHHKAPTRTSHASVRRLIDLAGSQTYEQICPWYVVPGNHDLSHDRLDSLDESQPLGVVIASGAVRKLDGWSGVEQGITAPIYGVPWQGTWDDQTVDAALADWRSRLTPDTPGLVVTHAPLYPPGQELRFENYPASRFAAAMGNHGSVAYGHVHEPHGIYDVNGVTFCNPGALSRGSLHEHNLTRGVAIASWNSDTGAFATITLEHKPAEQVFRLDEVGQVKTARLRLDQFLASIEQTNIQITTTEAVLDHIHNLGLGHAMEELAEELLTAVR